MTQPKPKPHYFGQPTAPDPVEAGRKGGKAVSIVRAIKDKLKAEPELLPELAASMIEAAKRGDATAVQALRTLLDRIDGPVAVELDVRTDTSRYVSAGETLTAAPPMPVEVQGLEAGDTLEGE